MQVGTDGICQKSLLYGWNCLFPGKGTAAMTYVENNPSLLGFKHKRFNLPGSRIHNGFPIRKTVRVGMGEDISGTKMLKKQFFNGIRWMVFAKIYHHRNICQFTCFHSTVNLCKIAPEVCRLNADNDLRI